MPKGKIKTIKGTKSEKTQKSEKYIIFRTIDTEDGRHIYDFSKLLKNGWHLTNAPILFKSDLEAKKQASVLLNGFKLNVSLKDIEVIRFQVKEVKDLIT